jgi:tRNA A37 threonylcarbamoyladenosine biosynthesis protein TsaE
MVVEWAEKIAPILPKNCLEIKFQVLPADRRKLELRGSSKKYPELFEERLDR